MFPDEVKVVNMIFPSIYKSVAESGGSHGIDLPKPFPSYLMDVGELMGERPPVFRRFDSLVRVVNKSGNCCDNPALAIPSVQKGFSKVHWEQSYSFRPDGHQVGLKLHPR